MVKYTCIDCDVKDKFTLIFSIVHVVIICCTVHVCLTVYNMKVGKLQFMLHIHVHACLDQCLYCNAFNATCTKWLVRTKIK